MPVSQNCSIPWLEISQTERSDSILCLFYKIIYGLVAIERPPYVMHPMSPPPHPPETHLPSLFTRFILSGLLRILVLHLRNRDTESVAPTHFCFFQNGWFARSTTKCFVFKRLAFTVRLFLTLNILPLSCFTLYST